MPNACITQFVGAMPGHGDGYVVNVAKDPIASEEVAIGATSLQSSAFDARCTLLRVHAEADCYVAIGLDPDAEDSPRMALAAGTTDHFGVQAGHCIAVVERTVA